MSGCAQDHPAQPSHWGALPSRCAGGRSLSGRLGHPCLGALHETGTALVQKPAHVEKGVPRACPPSLQTTLSSPGRTPILSVLTLRQSSKGSGGHPRPTDGRKDGLVGGMLCLGENPTGSGTLAVSVSPLRLPLTGQHTGEALRPVPSLRLPAVTHTKTTHDSLAEWRTGTNKP